jgi:hypothetical protein
MSKLVNVFVLFLIISLLSCNSRDKEGRNTYCEFVDGVYTFDLDLRRTLSYEGIDFDFKYYDDSMQEVLASEAKYVLLTGLGYYYDEKIHGTNDIEIHYSSIIPVPRVNKINNTFLNLLSTLQSERIIYLVNSGCSYTDANKSSHDEIINQLKSSSYFSSFNLDFDEEFCRMSIKSNLLTALTRALSYNINKSVENSLDKSIVANIWDDYILNFSMSGDLALSSLEPSDEESRSFINGLEADISLSASVSHYHIPFLGGRPQVKGNSIYYGIDTTSYLNKHDMSACSSLHM